MHCTSHIYVHSEGQTTQHLQKMYTLGAFGCALPLTLSSRNTRNATMHVSRNRHRMPFYSGSEGNVWGNRQAGCTYSSLITDS